MHSNATWLNDIARVASGATTTLWELKREMDAHFQARMDSWLAQMDVVSREAFEAQKALTEKALARCDALEQRIQELEQQMAGKSSAVNKASAGSKTRGRKK